jgi:ribosomal protein S18 acetylase RimI-like enzyme
VAVHDDAVIGMVLAYRLELPRAGPPVVLGGIGSVCVAPDHRGRGIARRLVQAAMSELARAGCDVAFLCADLQNPQLLRLYGGVGFVPLRRPYTYTGISGARYSGEDGMLAPSGSPALFTELLDQAEPLEIGRGNW